MKHPYSAPTEKQIALADWIAKTLGIDFPQCSKDFNKITYWLFCQKYLHEAVLEDTSNKLDCEDLYGICDNDVWCEFY